MIYERCQGWYILKRRKSEQAAEEGAKGRMENNWK